MGDKDKKPVELDTSLLKYSPDSETRKVMSSPSFISPEVYFPDKPKIFEDRDKAINRFIDSKVMRHELINKKQRAYEQKTDSTKEFGECSTVPVYVEECFISALRVYINGEYVDESEIKPVHTYLLEGSKPKVCYTSNKNYMVIRSSWTTINPDVHFVENVYLTEGEMNELFILAKDQCCDNIITVGKHNNEIFQVGKNRSNILISELEKAYKSKMLQNIGMSNSKLSKDSDSVISLCPAERLAELKLSSLKRRTNSAFNYSDVLYHTRVKLEKLYGSVGASSIIDKLRKGIKGTKTIFNKAMLTFSLLVEEGKVTEMSDVDLFIKTHNEEFKGTMHYAIMRTLNSLDLVVENMSDGCALYDFLDSITKETYDRIAGKELNDSDAHVIKFQTMYSWLRAFKESPFKETYNKYKLQIMSGMSNESSFFYTYVFLILTSLNLEE